MNEESVVNDAGHDTHQTIRLPPEGTSVVQTQKGHQTATPHVNLERGRM